MFTPFIANLAVPWDGEERTDADINVGLLVMSSKSVDILSILDPRALLAETNDPDMSAAI